MIDMKTNVVSFLPFRLGGPTCLDLFTFTFYFDLLLLSLSPASVPCVPGWPSEKVTSSISCCPVPNVHNQHYITFQIEPHINYNKYCVISWNEASSNAERYKHIVMYPEFMRFVGSFGNQTPSLRGTSWAWSGPNGLGTMLSTWTKNLV